MKKTVFLFLLLAFGLFNTIFAQEVVNASTSRGYLLGPGDEIAVKVLGEQQFDFEAALDENGSIEVPFFEKPLLAMCKNERELRTDVTQLLGKYLRSPQVSVKIKERKSRAPLTIYGEVRNPQQFILMRKFRLSEVIAAAGGSSDDAGGIVQIFRTQPPMCGDAEEIADWKAQAANTNGVPSSIYTLSSIKQGSEASNPIVYPGDIVVVEKAKPVYIVGEVKSPQGVYIKENGLSLMEAITMVGGLNREAKTKDIRIYRLKPNSKDREEIALNYEVLRKEGKQVMLEPYDIIEVDKAKKSIGQLILDIAINGGKTFVGGFPAGATNRILY